MACGFGPTHSFDFFNGKEIKLTLRSGSLAFISFYAPESDPYLSNQPWPWGALGIV